MTPRATGREMLFGDVWEEQLLPLPLAQFDPEVERLMRDMVLENGALINCLICLSWG